MDPEAKLVVLEKLTPIYPILHMLSLSSLLLIDAQP